MITENLISLIAGIVSAFTSLAPDLDLPFGTYPEQFATFVGSQLNGLDDILPITETAEVVGWVLTLYVPVVLAWYIVRWIYSHIPFI